MSGRGIFNWQQIQFPQAQMGGETFTSDWYINAIGPGASGAQGNLAATTAAQTTLQIQSDSAFELWKISYYATLNGVTEPQIDNIMCPVTVFIADGGSGRQLFSAPVPLSTIAGPGREPYPVPGRRIFLPNSTVTFTWYNPDSSAWNGILLVLHGRKLFNVTPT